MYLLLPLMPAIPHTAYHIFSTAVKKELLLKNPVMNATTPKDTGTKERAYLNAEQCKELLTIINEFSNPQLTRLVSGVRKGKYLDV